MSDLKTLQQSVYEEFNIDPQKLPQHVAIIMDGNGRWAKKRFLPRNAGHKEGAEALRKTIKACVELGIKYLSVYTFSTENWKRPELEVKFLMGFFNMLIRKELKELKKEGVRVRCLGLTAELNEELQKNIQIAETETAENTQLNLNLLLNYGSRREITEAVKQLAIDFKDNPEAITETTISDYLYTAGQPDPDVLIRTSGEYRISNYMLWQIAYSEIFVLDTLWPEFNREKLIEVIQKYQNRDRRFGGLSK